MFTFCSLLKGQIFVETFTNAPDYSNNWVVAGQTGLSTVTYTPGNFRIQPRLYAPARALELASHFGASNPLLAISTSRSNSIIKDMVARQSVYTQQTRTKALSRLILTRTIQPDLNFTSGAFSTQYKYPSAPYMNLWITLRIQVVGTNVNFYADSGSGQKLLQVWPVPATPTPDAYYLAFGAGSVCWKSGANDTSFSRIEASSQVGANPCGPIIKDAVTLSVDREIDIFNTVLQRPAMRASFKPNSALTLSEAAAQCGFTNFDWQQIITHLPNPSMIYQVGNPTPLSSPPAFFDPPPKGYTYCVPSFGSPCDQYPFYWKPNGTGLQSLSAYETTNTLSFSDAPSFPGLPPGDSLGFTTRLVGICNAIPSQLCSSSGGASIPLFEWTWTDTFNGTSGGVAKTYNMLPLDPGSGTGDIHITGLNGAPQVPPSVSCSANPSILWPPNGKAVLVTVSGNIAQGTQAIPSGGTAYAVTDEYGGDSTEWKHLLRSGWSLLVWNRAGCIAERRRPKRSNVHHQCYRSRSDRQYRVLLRCGGRAT